MVERSGGVMPPRPRPPKRTPKAVVYRRRAVALAVLVAGFLIAWFAVASGGGSDKPKPPPTTAAVAPPKPFRVIFPEGFTRKQMAVRVTAVAGIARRKRGKPVRLQGKAYLAATARRRPQPRFGLKPLPLEGFLFPATYDFTARTTSPQLVAAQLKAFRANWAKLNLAYARSKNLTPYDVLTIASMVEKETPAPEERQLVAGVIYNRLHLRMTLGIDATLRYGLDIPPSESIHASQLESTSPYNTRKYAGLPPTPIASPGLASLQAAAHPAKTPYLFFVAKPDKKHHFFTASSAEFERYKAEHGYR
ncbi:MAG TPA: endolytic transglycosylase MltG [Gaiellaceae bacterium]|nr:endolytic transglycosylase MltG [Gaiellaceae bacterium]